jgi:hypothetical protein
MRQASGREVGELASLLGLSYEAYEDLERFDEEIADCISLNQMLKLADAIGLDLRRFFAAENLGHVSFAELAARLEPFAATGPTALAAFEDRVGWELGRHLNDPSTFGELPAIALADIGESVGVDWRSLLPPSPATENFAHSEV